MAFLVHMCVAAFMCMHAYIHIHTYLGRLLRRDNITYVHSTALRLWGFPMLRRGVWLDVYGDFGTEDGPATLGRSLSVLSKLSPNDIIVQVTLT